MLCSWICSLPQPPLEYKKITLLSGLFIFQFIYELSTESLIETIPNYSKTTAMAISCWSSIPAILISTMWASLIKVKSVKPNEMAICLVAFLTLSSNIFSLLALEYIPYTLRLIAKSAKPVSVSLCKKCTNAPITKKKNMYGGCIVLGTILFAYDPNQQQSNYLYASGIICLMTSLSFDGATAVVEDKYLRKPELHPAVTMYYVHTTRIILSVPLILYYNLYYDIYVLCTTQFFKFLMISITSPVAQMCLFYALFYFGAYDTLIITTVRKAMSIAFSFMIFNHDVYWNHMIGLTILFYGLWNFLPERKPERINHNYEKLMNMV